MRRLFWIGREAIQIVVNRGQFKARIALQPLHQLPGIVVVITVSAAAVIVAVGMEQEKRRMLRIEAAGFDNLVVNLAEYVGILQRAETAPRILVADIAFCRHGDDLMNLPFRVFVLHIFRPEQAGRNFRSRPDIAQLQPVIDRRIDLLGGIGRQQALVDSGVGIILASAEAVDRVVNHRLDAGLIQRRNHPNMERGLRREHHAGGFDAKRGTDDVPMPLNLFDDVARRDQRHQRVEKAEGSEIDAGMTERSFFLGDSA